MPYAPQAVKGTDVDDNDKFNFNFNLMFK